LLGRLVQKVDIAEAFVVVLAVRIKKQALVHALLPAMRFTLLIGLIQVVVFVVPADVLIPRPLALFFVVLVIYGIEEVVVESLLALALQFLAYSLPVVWLAVLFALESLAVVQAVHACTLVRLLVVVGMVFFHGVAKGCFPCFAVILGRLGCFGVLRYNGAAVGILYCCATLNRLSGRQRLLNALRAEIKTLFHLTKGHRLWYILTIIAI